MKPEPATVPGIPDALPPFTLAEFQAQYPCTVLPQRDGNKIVHLYTRRGEVAIYQVTDYRVSSFGSGPAVWLVPVAETSRTCPVCKQEFTPESGDLVCIKCRA